MPAAFANASGMHTRPALSGETVSAVLESGKITDWLLVFARYLCRGETPISPEIPNKPLDELSKAELAQIHNSQAYKLMKRFPIPQLRQAAEAFQKQLEAGF
jgi:hypothetical protein